MNIKQLQELKDTKTIFYQLKVLLHDAIQKCFDLKIDINNVEIDYPKSRVFGHLTSNIILQIAKLVGKTPREAAQQILPYICHEDIDKVEIAGPGFLNFYLKKTFFHKCLRAILEDKDRYGTWDLGQNRVVLMEYGSPNAFKSLSVGHLRNAITGLSLSRLLTCLGYKVVNLNYYSDIGLHVAKSIYMFLRRPLPDDFEVRTTHEKMNYIVECYVEANKLFDTNPDVKAEIQQINLKIFSKEDDIINETYNKLLQWSLEHQHRDFFQRIGVKFDQEYSESQMSDEAVRLSMELEGRVLIRDDDALVFPGEQYNVNRYVFLSKYGTPTYSAKDMALALKKREDYPNYHFSIVLTSVEQNDYFKSLIAALCVYDNSFKDKYYHLGYGWLLGMDGKKASTRKGNIVDAVDYLNEAREISKERIKEDKNYLPQDIDNIAEKVGISGLKFLFLSHELHKDIIYNPTVFLDPQGYSGPYILYAYVRAKSILREANIDSSNFDSSSINTDYSMSDCEEELLEILSKFENITFIAGTGLSPHIIANYLFDLAQSFNKFYKENKVLVDNEIVRNFRLALTIATATVLANGLYLLGIETIDHM
ncbi:MAG: arginine--tRNA ligase [Candidatus Dojkabacteria bacterium]|nr:MAG: arginine--tRNA ligase [Candidatus Dojkabacteria bacterium]